MMHFMTWRPLLRLSSTKCIHRRLQSTKPMLYGRHVCTQVDTDQLAVKAKESSLYVRHDDLSNVAVVEVDLDLHSTVGNAELLKRNLELRQNNLDVDEFVSRYKEYVSLKEEEHQLGEKKLKVAAEMKQLKYNKTKDKVKDKSMEKELISQGRAIRVELKAIQAQLWALEADVILDGLNLPNDILPLTKEDDYIMEVYTPKQDNKKTENDVPTDWSKFIKLKPTSPGLCYLHGPLAKMELELPAMVSQRLRKAGIRQFSCPDMVKTIVMEGCGEDFTDPANSLLVQPKVGDMQAIVERGGDASNLQKWDIMMYLCGGSSLQAFASFLCKYNVARSSLPIKWFSIGRHYRPALAATPTLLNSAQATQVSLFSASDERDRAEAMYEEYISLLWNLYKSFSLPVRIVRVGASNLKRAEGSRTEIQAWLPQTDAYIKVASIGYYGQFISRRLMIKSSVDVNDVLNNNYLHMVYGTAVDTPRLMQAILEHGSFQGKSV